MLKIAQIHWTAKKLLQMVEKKEVSFDNPMQRGLVWDATRKSRLIHSMLEGYPIPALYTEKADGMYDVLDGKQRCNAIIDFQKDKFMLREETEVELSNGEFVNVNKKKFSQLNEELQDRIRDYNLSVFYVEDATYEQKKEMFIRLNSGKSMTNVELTKAQTKSAGAIVDIANHPVFNFIMDDKAKNKSANVGFAMQAYAILFNDSKCLLNTKIKETLKAKTISEDETNTILNLLNTYEAILNQLTEDKNENTPILSKLKRKSHFISLLPVVQYATENKVNDKKLADWIKIFFTSEEGTTISSDYNATLEGGMNRDPSVRARTEAALESFKAYLAGDMANISGDHQTTL
ncbi:MAG: DUF262 domain-containing protein [Oscillospiraceae bacterium]